MNDCIHSFIHACWKVVILSVMNADKTAFLHEILLAL